MEKPKTEKIRGLSLSKLYMFAMALAACGIIGGGILQTRLLNVGSLHSEDLLAKIQSSGWMMTAANTALLLQAIETCAVPVLAFILVEKMKDGTGLPYVGTVSAIALISEIPYDFAMSGAFVSAESQNPVMGILIAMIVLYFFRRYQSFGTSNLLIKAAVFIAGLVWVSILHIRHGTFLLIILLTLWVLRNKPLLRNFTGCIISVLCTVLSPFYLASPMGFLITHFYNGESGAEFHSGQFFIYPIMLLIIGILAALM